MIEINICRREKLLMLSLNRYFLKLVLCVTILLWTQELAIAGDVTIVTKNDLGGMSRAIMGSFDSLARFITAASYIAGLGFAIAAVLKFKQHKDNPTQVQIGTPISLSIIAGTLLFFPTILGVAGFTMFGNSGTTAGPSGMVFIRNIAQ